MSALSAPVISEDLRGVAGTSGTGASAHHLHRKTLQRLQDLVLMADHREPTSLEAHLRPGGQSCWAPECAQPVGTQPVARSHQRTIATCNPVLGMADGVCAQPGLGPHPSTCPHLIGAMGWFRMPSRAPPRPKLFLLQLLHGHICTHIHTHANMHTYMHTPKQTCNCPFCASEKHFLGKQGKTVCSPSSRTQSFFPSQSLSGGQWLWDQRDDYLQLYAGAWMQSHLEPAHTRRTQATIGWGRRAVCSGRGAGGPRKFR